MAAQEKDKWRSADNMGGERREGRQGGWEVRREERERETGKRADSGICSPFGRVSNAAVARLSLA